MSTDWLGWRHMSWIWGTGAETRQIWLQQRCPSYDHSWRLHRKLCNLQKWGQPSLALGQRELLRSPFASSRRLECRRAALWRLAPHVQEVGQQLHGQDSRRGVACLGKGLSKSNRTYLNWKHRCYFVSFDILGHLWRLCVPCPALSRFLEMNPSKPCFQGLIRK